MHRDWNVRLQKRGVMLLSAGLAIFLYTSPLELGHSLVGWIVLPFLFLWGSAPEGGDVSKFLYNSSQSFHPLFVSLGAFFLFAFGEVLLLKKKVLYNFVETIKEIRS